MTLSYLLLTPEQLKTWANKDFITLSRSLPSPLPKELEAFDWLARLRLDQIQIDSKYQNWSLRLIYIEKTNSESPTLVGLIGFHSPPNPLYLRPILNNAIELGYHILKDERRRGIASQAINDMMQLAEKEGVHFTVLSISFVNEASQSLAKKLSFTHFDNKDIYIEKNESVYYKKNMLNEP